MLGIPKITRGEDLAWRIRFKPKVKTMSGEKAEDPQSLQLRLSFLEMIQNGQRDSYVIACYSHKRMEKMGKMRKMEKMGKMGKMGNR